MSRIVQAIVSCGRDVRFLAHPRTRNALVKYSLLDKLAKAPNVEILGPANFMDFTRHLAGASKVVTDSGGVRREAYIFCKPVINISEFVWVPEMVEAGWSLPVMDDTDKIIEAIGNFTPPEEHPPIFGDGTAAKHIAAELVKRYGGIV